MCILVIERLYKMKFGKRSLVLCFGIVSIILAAFGAIALISGVLKDYDVEIGHFASSSAYATVFYGVMILSVVLGAVLAVLCRKAGNSNGKASGVFLSFTSAVTGFILIATVVIDRLQRAFIIEDSYSVLITLSSVFGILGAAALILFAFIGSYRTTIANILSFCPILYFIARTLIMYFEKVIAINGDLKIVLQLTFLAYALALLFDSSMYLGKKNMLPKLLFALIPAIIIGGSVSIAAISVYAIQPVAFNISLADCCMIFAFFLLCVAKLYHAAFAYISNKAEKAE